MSTCELCWATFPDDDELAKHVEIEEAVDWPIDGLDDGQDDRDRLTAMRQWDQSRLW